MSDKHTDALFELPELPRHKFCLNSQPVREGYTAAQMFDYAREAIRATQAQADSDPIGDFQAAARQAKLDEAVSGWVDGQAQTSAAEGLPEGMAEKLDWAVRPIRAVAVPECDRRADLLLVASTFKQILPDAAQLAHSTAPGAPVGMPSTMEEAYRSIQYLRDRLDAKVIELRDLKDGLAAPTAQRSLTAGGAVPRLPSLPMPDVHFGDAAFGDDGSAYSTTAMQKYARFAIELAAAPLPQVQSEALDDRSHWFKSWGGNEAEPMKLDPVVEANRAMLHQRSQLGIKKYGDTLAAKGYSRRELLQHALEEALDLANYLQADIQGIDAAADQQPVTPSGALADNDGGVA